MERIKPSIVLYMLAHGLEPMKELLDDEYLTEDYEILTFAGRPGCYGEYHFGNNRRDSTSMKITDELEDTFKTSVNENSDLLKLMKYSMDFPTDNPREFDEEFLKRKNLADEQAFRELPDVLRRISENDRIIYPGGGYKLIYPRFDKVFSTQPNPHENCSLCTETTIYEGRPLDRNRKPGSKCVPYKNFKYNMFPFFGIVVISSNPGPGLLLSEDNGFTMLTTEREDTDTFIDKYMTLHESYKLNKIYDEKVKNSRNPSKVQKLKHMDLFKHWSDKVTLTPDKKAELEERIFKDNWFFLSDVYEYFGSMGYEKIKIVDASCRTSNFGNLLKKLKCITPALSYIEQRPPSGTEKLVLKGWSKAKDIASSATSYFTKKRRGGNGKRRKITKKNKKRK